MSPQISLSSAPLADSRPLKRIGNTFTLGGACWIAHYVIQLVMGLSEGQTSLNSPWSLPDGLSFMAAIAALCVSLFRLGNSLQSRRGALAIIGQIFACIAGCSVVYGFARFTLNDQAPQIFGGIGVVGSCLSATFVALAVRRTQALPAQLSTLLLLTGLLTFPLIIAFIWPGQFVPAYLTDELPFALSGAAYVVFGRGLQKG